jgi:vacuolar protein sorting-associated protein 52
VCLLHGAPHQVNMWLDRFSGQSTPSGSHSPNRAYSPAPRRPSNLNPRAGLGLRDNRSATSLDLSNNISSVSLGSPTKSTHGSALRYEQKPPPEVQNPVAVIRHILGIPKDDQINKEKETDGHVDIGEDDLDIDFGGLSLQDYVDHDQPRAISKPSRAPLSQRKKDFEEFHTQISESDQVLKSVEVYLTNFKAELGQVSAEIESLQTRSVQLNARLENRRQVEKLLGPAVEEVSISPAIVKAIAEGPIDDSFARALNEVESRLTILEKKSSSENVKALEDVRPLLEDLKSKAIERIRDFIVSQIKALRSPNINAQIIQQQHFIKHKDLFSFLARHHPILSEEICQAYINTMKWYYSTNFGRYQHALQKMQLHNIGPSDLMGTDQTPKKTTLGANKSAPPHDTFALGKRIGVVQSKDDAAISSYLAEDDKSFQYLEIPFRNFNQALIDNVCAEYSVATEIFTGSYQQVSRQVIEIFEPTFALGHTFTKQLVETTSDCLGILICVRLNQHFAFELQRRKCPVVDSYINYTNILLWPRFQVAMDQHCDSLKKVPTSQTSRTAAAAFSLVSGTNSDTSKTSVAPHAITQRFGQFLHGILSLSTDAGDDEPLGNSLGRLRTEYETLMVKLSKAAGDKSKQARFLANNYSLVLTIIGDVGGKLAEDQREHFGAVLLEAKGR